MRKIWLTVAAISCCLPPVALIAARASGTLFGVPAPILSGFFSLTGLGLIALIAIIGNMRTNPSGS